MVGRELPQIEEKEPNNGRGAGAERSRCRLVNGHIGDASDIDTYAVELEAGKAFVAEVVAAQAGSPLDSLLTLERLPERRSPQQRRLRRAGFRPGLHAEEGRTLLSHDLQLHRRGQRRSTATA